MKFRDVKRILRDNGISFKRYGKGKHEIWEGTYDGKTQIVELSCSQDGDDVPKGTLGNIKRQSGLPKKLFRK